MSSLKGKDKRQARMPRKNTRVDKTIVNNGIYRNNRFVHTATSLIGCNVEVTVKNGGVYEGILKTISAKMDVALEMAHKVDETICLGSVPSSDLLLPDVIFEFKDVVNLTARNVNISEVNRSAEDVAISSKQSNTNGGVAERELTAWEPDTNIQEESLEEHANGGGSSGWDATQMFDTNSKKFNIKSTYDSNLHQYTTPLRKENTAEWKEREARALQLAREIESSESYKRHVELENGGDKDDGDEEMRYSAVHRPGEAGASNEGDQLKSGKYVPPHIRKNSNYGRSQPRAQQQLPPQPMPQQPVQSYSSAAAGRAGSPSTANQQSAAHVASAATNQNAAVPPTAMVAPQVRQAAEAENKHAERDSAVSSGSTPPPQRSDSASKTASPGAQRGGSQELGAGAAAPSRAGPPSGPGVAAPGVTVSGGPAQQQMLPQPQRTNTRPRSRDAHMQELKEFHRNLVIAPKPSQPVSVSVSTGQSSAQPPPTHPQSYQVPPPSAAGPSGHTHPANQPQAPGGHVTQQEGNGPAQLHREGSEEFSTTAQQLQATYLHDSATGASPGGVYVTQSTVPTTTVSIATSQTTSQSSPDQETKETFSVSTTSAAAAKPTSFQFNPDAPVFVPRTPAQGETATSPRPTSAQSSAPSTPGLMHAPPPQHQMGPHPGAGQPPGHMYYYPTPQGFMQVSAAQPPPRMPKTANMMVQAMQGQPLIAQNPGQPIMYLPSPLYPGMMIPSTRMVTPQQGMGEPQPYPSQPYYYASQGAPHMPTGGPIMSHGGGAGTPQPSAHMTPHQHQATPTHSAPPPPAHAGGPMPPPHSGAPPPPPHGAPLMPGHPPPPSHHQSYTQQPPQHPGGPASAGPQPAPSPSPHQQAGHPQGSGTPQPHFMYHPGLANGQGPPSSQSAAGVMYQTMGVSYNMAGPTFPGLTPAQAAVHMQHHNQQQGGMSGGGPPGPPQLPSAGGPAAQNMPHTGPPQAPHGVAVPNVTYATQHTPLTTSVTHSNHQQSYVPQGSGQPQGQPYYIFTIREPPHSQHMQHYQQMQGQMGGQAMMAPHSAHQGPGAMHYMHQPQQQMGGQHGYQSGQ